jgi:hypothetical protein
VRVAGPRRFVGFTRGEYRWGELELLARTTRAGQRLAREGQVGKYRVSLTLHSVAQALAGKEVCCDIGQERVHDGRAWCHTSSCTQRGTSIQSPKTSEEK